MIRYFGRPVLLVAAFILCLCPVAGLPVVAEEQTEFPLIAAVQAQDTERVKTLLATGLKPDTEQQGEYGMTPLMSAASNDNVEIAKLLVAAGANLDLRDKYGDPAINWAAYYGNAKFVRFALRNRADTSLVGHGNTFQVLIRRGFDDLAREIVEYEGRVKSLEAADIQLAEAVRSGDLEAAQQAIDAGADASGADAHGFSHMITAAKRGDVAMVSVLAEAGADIDGRDPVGFSPLSYAARDGHTGLVKILIEAGVDVNQQGLRAALYLSPLHMAASGGQVAVVGQLVAAGADVNSYSEDGGAPFVWAMFTARSEETAIRLLELGANPELGIGDRDRLLSQCARLGMEKLAARLRNSEPAL